MSAQSNLSPQEIHDHIVAIIQKNAARLVPAGDTFVNWSPTPVLYSTVHRATNQVQSSLIRNDAMVGTTESVWSNGAPTHVHVKWTQGDSLLLELTITIAEGHIRGQGTRVVDMPAPQLPWGIADYGMEDQLLPLVAGLPTDGSPHAVHVFRPYPAKWDSLTVMTSQRDGWLLATLREPDGEDFFWVIAADGALIRITRSKHADDERMPLINSPRWDTYVRYRHDSQ